MTAPGPARPSGMAAAVRRLHNPERQIRPLAGLQGARPPAPAWYEAAMAVPVEQHRIEVDGAGIEMLCWGEIGRPGILLIHGSSAHARWWGPVAPMLAREHRVAAFSWSGTGGSDWREGYAVAQTAREAWAVAAAGDLFAANERPMLVAHSFGSKAGALVAAEHGATLRGAVLIDSLLVPDEQPGDAPLYRARRYDSEAAALARFRFAPDQPADNLFIADDIARAGLRQAGDAWTWRFDPDFYPKLDFTSGWAELARPRCPLAFVRGEESIMLLDEDVAVLRAHVPAGTIFLDIPGAHHHVMVDQPIALVAVLRALAAGWR